VARIRVSIVIDARPAEVWWAVEDIASHVDWMLDARSIRFTSSQRAGVGTTFECVTGVGPFRFTDRMEVTQWVPGKAMGVAHAGLVTGTGRFTLRRARRGRTRFSWEEQLALPRWLGGRIGAVAAKPVLTAVWRRSLRNLKAKVESGHE
jgi:uncharacterized protein YndB with AHSA1/START domain